MEAPPASRANPLAWLSLLLGLLVPVSCGASGPFALLFGFLALRRVNLSDGRLPGARAARAGMVLGTAGITLFLVGLLVVVLVQQRGKSEVAVCTDNLRRIGQAVNLYHDEKGNKHYPSGTIPLADVPPEQRLSWMVAILPYMEGERGLAATTEKSPVAFQRGEELYTRFDPTKGADAPENRKAMTDAPLWFACPAGPRPTPGEPAFTQYVGIGGFGADAPTLTRADPRAGFFGYDRVISRDDIKRGTAQTLMVSERAGAVGPWGVGGPATVAGVDPAKEPYVPGQFGGLHAHGANTLFADGHATFITDRANPIIWQEQSRINVDY
jgi:prepilin-type processing-associated H-X9-DG protein